MRVTSRRGFVKLAALGAAGTAILAACGPAAVPTATTAPAAPGATATAAPAAAATSAPAGAAPTPTAASQTTSGEKITITISHIGGGSLAGSEKSYRAKQMHAHFTNLNIVNNWISYSDYVDKISLMTSTGTLSDLQFCNALNDVPLMMNNNLLIETGSLLQQYGKNILAVTPAEAWNSTLYDGKQYAVNHNIYNLNVWGIQYRKDWLDKLGLQVPTTLDEYAKVANAMTFKDPDGNGKADTYGRMFFNSVKFDDDLFHAFGVGVGHHANGFWTKGADGKISLDWVNPNMKTAWTWLRDLWAAKVVDPDSMTQQITYWGQPWTAGTLGTMYSSWSGLDGTLLQIQKVAPGAKIVGGPALKGPNGDQGFTGEDNPWVFVTPKTSKHPDLAMGVIDWFYDIPQIARFVCDGEMGYDLKGINSQGWCQEYTLAEKQAMGSKFTDLQTAGTDVSTFNGIWTGISSGALGPWVLNKMPAEMKAYFEEMLKNKYSPEALATADFASKYVKLTAKPRPTASEQKYWPSLQSRFLELMDQAIAGTLAVDSAWSQWNDYFTKNGGPTLVDEVNALK